MSQLHPLEEIGIEYHVNTEKFDRRICLSYQRTGKAIPMDKWEREKCNQNAMRELSEARSKAARLFGYQGSDQIKKWISKTADHPEVQRRLKEME